MQSFRIKPGALKETRKKMLLVIIPAFLIPVTIALINIGSSLTYGFVWSYEQILPLSIIVLCLGIPVYSMYRVFSRTKKVFESYELQISNNLIGREQLNTPTISIYFKDVQEIVKRKNGSFMVRGTAANDLIFIPKQIENYDQLETALDQIKPITTKSQKTNIQIIQGLLGLVAVGLLVCVNTLNNKIIVALAGFFFTGITIWNLIQIQRNKNVDYRTKRFRWLSLIIVIVTIYIVIQKLTSPETP